MTVLIVMMLTWIQRTSRLVVSSILMPSQPSTSKNIMSHNNLHELIEFAWEVLKPHLILNKKTLDPHYKLSFP